MKIIILKLIKAYQQSGLYRNAVLKNLFLSDASCRFNPTCSAYTYQAVAKYGTMRGIVLGGKRILKCHPWSKGGNDPLK